MEHRLRTRLVTALVLAAVFGAGVLLGLAADSNLGATPPEVTADAPETETEEAEAPRRRRIYDQVEPTEDQRHLIDSIIEEHRARTNALDDEMRAEYRGGFRVILLETREAIKGVLTTEQATEYERLLEEYDARGRAERDNGDEPN
jgi:Spy/CpxP family protein refolding chaperone